MNKLTQILAGLIVLTAGGCAQYSSMPVTTYQWYNPADAVQQYVQRADKVTLTAGNAEEVNTRIQETDPWPRNVGNTRIAADGKRMADAVYRYGCNSPAPPAAPLGATTTTASSGGGGGGGGGGGAAITRPSSGCAGGGGAGGGSGGQ
jgi:uncharacterized membrane protein YgcG